jgi:hypothetical protein
MKRCTFLMIAAIIPGLFGFVMMITPGLILSNTLVGEINHTTRIVTQWVGFGVFTLGLINLLSRNDPGSVTLEALMIGNIVFHLLGLAFDIYDFSLGVMGLTGLITGLIPHSLFIIGFSYYLNNMIRS